MSLMTMRATASDRQSGYRGGAGSPVGIGGAVAVHALVVGAYLLMPREVIAPYVPQIFIGNQIPLDPPPPETVDPAPEAKVPTRSASDPRPAANDPLVTLPTTGGDLLPGGVLGGEGIDTGDLILPPPDPQRDPVLVEPGIDPRAVAAFQPDYPGSMVRQGLEGSVTVRVAIGADGRVTRIERLTATDEAFWVATQRHALRKWRFRPATRDGAPVSGSKVLTVHFRLADN